MAGYLTGTLINFTRRTVDGYSVPDYNTRNFTEIKNFINNLPSDVFDYYMVQNNDNIERIALELYNNPDLWDVLLLINNRDPLSFSPFDFDTVVNLSEDKVQEYEANVYNISVPQKEREIMYTQYEKTRVQENESDRIIKIIKPNRIGAFLQSGHELGLF